MSEPNGGAPCLFKHVFHPSTRSTTPNTSAHRIRRAVAHRGRVSPRAHVVVAMVSGSAPIRPHSRHVSGSHARSSYFCFRVVTPPAALFLTFLESFPTERLLFAAFPTLTISESDANPRRIR